MVTDIEDISKAIQKYTTKQTITGSIGAATTISTISNHLAFPNDVKDIYLDKGNPQFLMTVASMKHFKTGIPDPSDPTGNTMMTQEYHLDLPVTRYCIFTRDGTYFQLIKQDASRYKRFVSTILFCCGSSPTSIRMWYQSVTIHSATHGIYVYTYYLFIPEVNYFKGISTRNDTNRTKHDLPEKYSTMLS